MIPLRAQQDIMELAAEDFTPLHDVTSVVGSYAPDRSVEEHVRLAKEFVVALVARGYLGLFYDCLGQSNDRYRHGVELTESEVRAELDHQENWLYHDRRPPDERWVAIATTSVGEAALRVGEFHTGENG